MTSLTDSHVCQGCWVREVGVGDKCVNEPINKKEGKKGKEFWLKCPPTVGNGDIQESNLGGHGEATKPYKYGRSCQDEKRGLKTRPTF